MKGEVKGEVRLGGRGSGRGKGRGGGGGGLRLTLFYVSEMPNSKRLRAGLTGCK